MDDENRTLNAANQVENERNAERKLEVAPAFSARTFACYYLLRTKPSILDTKLAA